LQTPTVGSRLVHRNDVAGSLARYAASVPVLYHLVNEVWLGLRVLSCRWSASGLLWPSQLQTSVDSREVVMYRNRILAMLALIALLLSGAAMAQPKVVELPELGIEPGTVGGTVTLPLGAAPPTFLYYAQID